MKEEDVLNQIENIKKELKEKEIENIYLNFVDFSGNILTKMVGVQELINNTHVSWFNGISINGSLLEDFNDSTKGDWLVLLPDPFSFRIIPFLKDENQKSALIFCSIKNNPYDTRGLLEDAVAEFQEMGITPMFGTQLIYSSNINYYPNSSFRGARENEDYNKCNFYEDDYQNFYEALATSPRTIFQNILVNSLLKSKIDIEYYMPYGNTHNRIDLVPDIANVSADKLWTAKWFAMNLARKENMKISFKNLEHPYLSSCPIHMSLWKGKREKNLFFDGDDKYELSQLGKDFMNGILFHQKALKALINATSTEMLKTYKTKISIRRENALLQVPLYFNEKQKQDRVGWSKRCIYNGLNANQNYYLMFSALLYAGLYGIKHKDILIENSEMDLYSKSQLIKSLEENEYFKEKLGEKIIEKAIEKLRNKN